MSGEFSNNFAMVSVDYHQSSTPSFALESPDKEFFNAAVGYADLGMCQDANDELEKIDPFNRAANFETL